MNDVRILNFILNILTDFWFTEYSQCHWILSNKLQFPNKDMPIIWLLQFYIEIVTI